ncbi:serpin family protein [Roseofilum sp. Belize Diploria]|uniref:serpin family protein n=1 Tax=Roseofilum sp. Belize Diploria TaxID=2821501 RepID=UPI000E805395|nr:serpin family protein [Roseofilum sp. Belize Diploria]MBP0009170.1 serpin family protein [Roseofilum sp. Belize Diploria]HBR00722.1 proteinase inhibitor I4 serpin [Cyanobacteria bacterium UBA11691]
MTVLTLKKLGMLMTTGLVLLGLWGCFRPTTPGAIASSPIVSATNTGVNPQLTDAHTRFSFKLWQQLLAQEETKNIFISPSSVAIALTMTYNGASGDTQTAMANALELQGMSLNDINQAYATLKQRLENTDESIELSIANSLWGRNDVNFKADFLQQTKTYYDAKVRSLDFTDPATPKHINNWVQRQTKGKIPQIVDQINPDDLLFLINATYFHGQWQNEFNPTLTQERPFYLLNGQEKQHPMMFQTGSYDYLENEQFQAIRLPYGDGRFSLYVFLPQPEQNLSQFYAQLNSSIWQTWLGQFQENEGSIALPKFQLEYGVELKPVLSALGMDLAFSQQADFSEISDISAKIDGVKHKTFVEVNEKGTEAAAVTSVGIVATSIRPPSNPFEMVVDRPFFCAIYDHETQTPLFFGSIVNPE